MDLFLKRLSETKDFTGLYLGIKNLKSSFIDNLKSVDHDHLRILFSLLLSKKHENQSRSFFLYREISDILVDLLQNIPDIELKEFIKGKLCETVLVSANDRLRAIGDSISDIKLGLKAENFHGTQKCAISEISIKDFAEKSGFNGGRWLGRSFVLSKGDIYAVFKFLRKGESFEDLKSEILWMERLKKYESDFFSVPKPLFEGSQSFIKVTDINKNDIHENGYAIAFEVRSDYYRYPNEKNKCLDEKKFSEIICRNSYLTGYLAGMGIIHTALIPLFHNTVQRQRRDDEGLYLWEKGGRLDNWLGSCRYPNFGFSGLRDFEHFIIFDGDTKSLYRHVGNHILSFVLVLGSFFRNVGCDSMKDSFKVGVSGTINSVPVDATELFEQDVFKEIFHLIFSEYMRGFTGKKGFEIPEDKKLIDRLIENMGRDIHMEEVIRRIDQINMDEDDFRKLLISKNIDPSTIPGKGLSDIVVNSGPHLGQFNGPISVPELTDFIIKASSVSIIEKFFSENLTK